MPSSTSTHIDAKALALAVSLFWGFIVLIVALGNLGLPPYGSTFLEIAASIYPGYEAGSSLPQLLLVTFYALVDGAIAGAVVAWLYNRFAG